MNKYITEIKVLNTFIKEEGIIEYIRDYFAAVNHRLSIMYETEDFYIAEDNMIPYVMISNDNEIAKKLQTKHGAVFAKKLFYFYAKGKYELE